ncbi:hypothetical protein DOE78_15830 [Bacillus sp. Y1]|nr:hypothetical protein DOE78_15830 [Bacillus sp. Y1]
MIKMVYISGYKASELGIFKENDPGVVYIKLAIKKALLKLIDQGLEWVMVSGQLGVEMWAAEVVIELRKKDYPDLKLAIITPFLDQEGNWSDKNKEWYHSIIQKADYVDSVTKRKYDSPAQFRLKNQFAIKKTDALLLVYDEERDGSPKYLLQTAKHYQENNEYPITQINFYDLQLLVEEVQQKQNDFY